METKTKQMKYFVHYYHEDIIAFISGSVLSGLFSSQFVEKIITTMIIAFFGGIMGIMGKETYSFIKKKLFGKDTDD